MKVKPQIPLIVLLSWVSLYGFSDSYIVTSEKKISFSKYIMFENGFDTSFSVLEFHKRNRTKQGTRL